MQRVGLGRRHDLSVRPGSGSGADVGQHAVFLCEGDLFGRRRADVLDIQCGEFPDKVLVACVGKGPDALELARPRRLHVLDVGRGLVGKGCVVLCQRPDS